MKISRKAKTGCAVVLAALMTLTGLSMKQTYAAAGVDLDVKGSITVLADLGANNAALSPEDVENFNNMFIPIMLYRVADVDVTGQNYTANEAFKVIAEDLKGLSSDTNADQWQAMAERAAAKENLDAAAANDTSDEPLYFPGKITGGKVEFTGMTPGMYLVVPDETYNADYTMLYRFAPYLTALPSSEYTLTGQGSDAWVYDTEIGLKPEAEPQYGDLIVKKQLENYNTTLGAVTCVFRAEGRDAQDQIVYSEVASTTHKDTTEVEIRFEHIPAGIDVTVTEEYSGASYKPSDDSERSQTVKIWSKAAVDKGVVVDGAPVETASLTFKNQYDGGNRGGYGVTNVFENKDAGWTWTTKPVNPNKEN